MAASYGVTVFVHSDHCAKKLLPWFDGMLAADREYFDKHGEVCVPRRTNWCNLLGIDQA